MSFNTKDELGDKIDKLTVVMSKLAAKDSHKRRSFKPPIHKSRGQNTSYGQGGYRARSNDRNRGYCASNNTRQNYQGNRFRGTYRRDRSSSNDRSRSGSRASTNRDRIRCYACRVYDHFARDCPKSREERDLEQLQHMLNMEERDHTSPSIHSSDEDCRSPFNL